MAKHKHKIIYEFGLGSNLHYTIRYYDKNELYGSQHFNNFDDASNCPYEKLIFKKLKYEQRCPICNAK